MSSTTKKEAVKATKTTKAPAPAAKMYVGPTIPGVAIQNRIYTEMPAAFEEARKELPEMANLCIPVREYPTAERMLRERKGYIYSAYMKALEYKQGGKKS